MISGFPLLCDNTNNLSFSKEGDTIRVDYYSVFDKKTLETDTFVATFDKSQFCRQLLDFPKTKRLSITNKNGDTVELTGSSGKCTIVLSRGFPGSSFSISDINFDYKGFLDALS